ncbi:MFS transporter [Nonomuraea insulae]|uniref:MFS transporter n=1 Tax=Nonomuraea insulae TaxID=1616787 RepID=A0ABW1CPX5_9ACTN
MLELLPAAGPPRVLAALTCVQSMGTGVFLASGVVFFTTVAGMEAGQVGVALSVAGLCGVLVSVPVGRLADRVGARRLLIVSYVVSGPLFALYAGVGSILPFLIVSSLIAVCEGAADPLRATLTFAVGGKDAAKVRGQLRSIYNLGFVAGAALAAGALVTATRAAFYVVVLATAAAQLACAAIAARLPDGARANPAKPHGDRATPAKPHGDRATPAKPNGARVSRTEPAAGRRVRPDPRFVLLTLVNGGMELHVVIMTLGFPLWIVTHTDLPASLNSLLLALNTTAVVLFQVAAGRRTATVPDAGRLQLLAGILLGAACAVAAVSGSVVTAAAGWALAVACLLLVAGELLQTAGSFTLSFELPPPGRQGEHQGIFSLRKGLRQTAGPALVTWLVAGLGGIGWLALAVLFVVLGAIGRHLSLAMYRSRRSSVQMGNTHDQAVVRTVPPRHGAW